ncbi:MAG: hypothetical protein OER95_07330 [Acidimicrobiia bacterium]|nr:hypothetical protein [Acidimicrobiia bacterium]
MGGLRRILVDSPNSLGGRARLRRAARLLEAFPDLADMRVLDLGGTMAFWGPMPVLPRQVVTLNHTSHADADAAEVEWHERRIGDACDPPADLMVERFDLVFSNSTIEHVGDRTRRRQFADAVHKLADRHWVQTPNRYFPLEPHVLFPFQQFLPRYGRALVERYWPLVHTRWKTMDQALASADATELIGRRELSELFPGSEIEAETVLPLVPAKSLIAICR